MWTWPTGAWRAGKLESERVRSAFPESERDQLEVTVDPSTGLLVYKVSGHPGAHGVGSCPWLQLRRP